MTHFIKTEKCKSAIGQTKKSKYRQQCWQLLVSDFFSFFHTSQNVVHNRLNLYLTNKHIMTKDTSGGKAVLTCATIVQ